MNGALRTGKIGALAGSGSAEKRVGFGDGTEPTRVYASDGEAEPTDDHDAVARRLLPESGPNGAPSKVGRYVVLDVLGMGGMGVVCTAYDPKLDRKVALKLLRRKVGRPGRTSTGRARLVREAQSLAKLSHPNIVTVHDVDTTPDGRIYMAMEFVHGQTITQWVSAEKPNWRAILRVFDDAGRGLAAAHAASIIHRDFKPANVLIARDGRVKVLDFGLAKSDAVALSTDSDDSRGGDAGEGEGIMQVVHSTGDMKLTMAGRIVGTPAYMAPEQRRGKPTGPATDQFGFAVSLYEALYGKLPFRTESHSRDAARGRILDPPSDTEVPSWVFRALRLALAPQPADRYPNMGNLLDALRADPAKRRRRIAMWGGGVAVLGTTLALAAALSEDEAAVCQGARGRLAGVWDSSRRAVVDGSLRDTATAYAAYTADRVVEDIDAYADSWVLARTRVCEATWKHGEQSQSTLDVRMRCLDQRQGELRALVAVLADADNEVVERAVSAVAALTSAQTCEHTEAGASNQLPSDPIARSRVLSVQARIDDAEALLRAGRYRSAQEVSRDALTLPGADEHVPTRARGQYVQGLVAQKLGDFDLAASSFETAAQQSASASDPALETKALIDLVRVYGVHKMQASRALGLAVAAESALVRAGTPAQLRSRLALQLGTIALAAREMDEAVQKLREALEWAQRAYPPGDVRMADMLMNLGVALAQQGAFVESETILRRALDLRETKQGRMHPNVASVALNLANVVSRRPAGNDEAIELIDRAMAIRRAVYGPDAKLVAVLLVTKARLHAEGGDVDRAESEYRKAAAIYRKSDAPFDLGDTLTNLAKLELGRGNFDIAAQTAIEAMGSFRGDSARAQRGRARASLRSCIATRSMDAGSASALERCQEAARRMEAVTPEQGDELSRAQQELALVHGARGEVAKAREQAAHAVASAQSVGSRTEATAILDRLQSQRR